MPTTPNKTVAVILIAWQDIPTGTVVISPAQDVNQKWAAAFSIRVGRKSSAVFTTGWPNIRIEASTKTAGNNSWIPLFAIQTAIGGGIAGTTLNGAVVVGASTFSVVSATNITAGDILFLGDALPTNYELVRVLSVSGTTVTVEEPVTNSHTSGASVTDQAEMNFPSLDLSMYSRVRAVVDNANSGQSIAVEITMSSFDSF